MIRNSSWIAQNMRKSWGFILGMGMSVVLMACGNQNTTNNAGESGTMNETATDGTVDVNAIAATNPDVIGWLYVPGTNIDYPICQNIDGDDTYYESHECNGFTQNDKGGIYIEAGNMMDMCDFNTVIHGKTTSDNDMFSELWNFADEKFFEENSQFVIFTPDNMLTYEIWTAYQRDNTSLIREYDFSENDGCESFLQDMKKDWTTNTNFRSGWEQGVTADNFLVTLTTVDKDHPDKQWVVVGCMIGDAAGTIDR
ncbi:MAG: class B sortase [Butyrivibrio sp.]|nr:class B sortase [Butyrivibrio sp.]